MTLLADVWDCLAVCGAGMSAMLTVWAALNLYAVLRSRESPGDEAH